MPNKNLKVKLILEVCKVEHKLMTEHEKADIFMKSFEIQETGDKEKAMELRRTVPLPPYMAKFIKEKIGIDFLISNGYNLAEAEAEYGQDWLTA